MDEKLILDVMAQYYRRFIKILEKWPSDKESMSSGLAYHLREQGKVVFDKHGELRGNQKDCDRRLASLERICSDRWLLKYPRTRQSSSTGLTAEHCKLILTKEFQEELHEWDSSFLGKWFNISTKTR